MSVPPPAAHRPDALPAPVPPAPPPAARRWLRLGSISVRMIVTIALLLIGVLAAFVVVYVRDLEALGTQEADARRVAVETAMRQLGMTLARSTSVASQSLLASNNFTDLRALVADTVRTDQDVRFVIVSDEAGRVVAQSGLAAPAAAGRVTGDGLSADLRREKRGGVVLRRDAADSSLWVFATPVLLPEGAGSRGGPPLGELRVGVSMAAHERAIAGLREATRERVRRAVRLALAVAALLLAIGVLVAVLQGLRISRPLTELAVQAERIAGGDLGSRVQARGRDEIAHLSTSFNFMADRLAALLQEAARQAIVEKEVEVARMVQEALVPPRTTLEACGVHLSGLYEPASMCGGDWWTWKELSGGRVLLAIGDVTGHGIPAALITAAAVGCCETLPADVTAERALRSLDRAVRLAGKGEFLMSCFAAVFNVPAGVIEYSNAGHPYPYLARRAPTGWVTESLGAPGPLLGDGAADGFVVRRVAIVAGDVIVLFTDGVNERRGGRHGDLWGQRRLHAAIIKALEQQGVRGVQPTANPSAVRDHVLGSLSEFAGDAALSDDITIVVGSVDDRVATQLAG